MRNKAKNDNQPTPMAKTPLFSALKKAFQLARISEQPGLPPADEIHEWLENQRENAHDWSRRQFVRNTLQTGLILGAGSLLPGCVSKSGNQANSTPPVNPVASGPRIAIVGAGIAGLHAGYLLKKGGFDGASLQIFEASRRTGGRMFTNKIFGNNMTTEFGGEFFDKNNTDMLQLAEQFGITILRKESDKLISDAFFLEGKHHSMAAVVKAFQKCRKKIAKDANSLGEDYDTPDCIRLDKLPLKSYIDSLPTDTWFKKLLDVAYEGEYGLSTEEQSALNLIDMIGDQASGFDIFGESDESIKLLGGNQQICDRLADTVKEHIQLGYTLTAIKDKGEGYLLTFSTSGGTKEVEADHVVMTIPFTVLRDVEGLDKLAKITPEKLQCIRELGYGTNGKIFLGLNDRPWRKAGYQGYIYTEKIHTGWDNYHLQNNNAGPAAYTVFQGGISGASVTPEKAAEHVPVLDKAFPGFKAAHNPAQIAAMNWTTNPQSKGSYGCYKPGQWTSISGQEIVPIGNMLFAGEHCSSDFQGYMNGAAETGRVAAEQILAKTAKK